MHSSHLLIILLLQTVLPSLSGIFQIHHQLKRYPLSWSAPASHVQLPIPTPHANPASYLCPEEYRSSLFLHLPVLNTETGQNHHILLPCYFHKSENAPVPFYQAEFLLPPDRIQTASSPGHLRILLRVSDTSCRSGTGFSLRAQYTYRRDSHHLKRHIAYSCPA